MVSVLLDEANNVIIYSEPTKNLKDVSCDSIGILEIHKEEFTEIFSLDEGIDIRLNCKDGIGVGYMPVAPSMG